MTRTEQQAQTAELIDQQQRLFSKDVDGALAAADLAPRAFRDAVKAETLRIGNQTIVSHSGTLLPHAGNLLHHVVRQLKSKQVDEAETRRCGRLHRTPEQAAAEDAY